MKKNIAEIKKEIEAKWSDKHFLELGIYQHLIECKQKFEATKNHSLLNLSKKKLKYELDKELTDLKILLDMYTSEELLEKRINKFWENSKK